MNLKELIKKCKENITECDRVIQAYKLSEETRYIHKGIKQTYQEILSDLESHKELVYEILCGQYKYIYDKEKDFTEIADGIYQCIVDEEVFYQYDRYDGKIYNLTFLGIIGE